MKILVCYSSLTGNTKLAAEAIADALKPEAVLVPMEQAPDWRDFDLVIVGFWIDKGVPNAAAQRYIEELHDVRTAFFFTLGAAADSDHARQCAENAGASLARTQLVGSCCCQGKISPELIQFMKRLPSQHPHGPNPERIARWEQASTHPDGNDLNRLAAWARDLRRRIDATPEEKNQ